MPCLYANKTWCLYMSVGSLHVLYRERKQNQDFPSTSVRELGLDNFQIKDMPLTQRCIFKHVIAVCISGRTSWTKILVPESLKSWMTAEWANLEHRDQKMGPSFQLLHKVYLLIPSPEAALLPTVSSCCWSAWLWSSAQVSLALSWAGFLVSLPSKFYFLCLHCPPATFGLTAAGNEPKLPNWLTLLEGQSFWPDKVSGNVPLVITKATQKICTFLAIKLSYRWFIANVVELLLFCDIRIVEVVGQTQRLTSD